MVEDAIHMVMAEEFGVDIADEWRAEIDDDARAELARALAPVIHRWMRRLPVEVSPVVEVFSNNLMLSDAETTKRRSRL